MIYPRQTPSDTAVDAQAAAKERGATKQRLPSAQGGSAESAMNISSHFSKAAKNKEKNVHAEKLESSRADEANDI